MLLKNVKRTSLQVCKKLGLFRMVRESRWRRGRLLILGYHGVSLEDEHEWDASLYMSQRDFEARLRILKKENCSVLPLGEAIERLYRNDLPERSVALTFDDGYYDFYRQASPMLSAYGFPSTVYLTTYHCYYNKPIFGLVCPYLLWKRRGQVIDAPPPLESGLKFDLRDAGGRDAAMAEIWKYSDGHRLSSEEKNEFARRLAEYLGLDYDEILEKRLLHLMNPQEVTEMAERGVDFQLHTHRHYAPVNERLFHKEIDENRAKLEELTGERAAHFCYPSGVHRPQYLPWLQDAEMVSATTCDAAFASSETNALLLPRLVDHSSLSPVEFESWLTGFAKYVPTRMLNGNAQYPTANQSALIISAANSAALLS
jgi:peptidoglycan/xylan/chitin deacetylase (PgdA/CDA1 family)